MACPRQGARAVIEDIPAGIAPPHSLDAEGAVLSHCMLHESPADVLPQGLKPEHFYADVNRAIFDAIVALHTAGKPCDPVAVRGWLAADGRLQMVSSKYIGETIAIGQPACSVAAVQMHAEEIRETYRRRKLIAALLTVAAELRSGTTTVENAWRAVREECSNAG